MWDLPRPETEPGPLRLQVDSCPLHHRLVPVSISAFSIMLIIFALEPILPDANTDVLPLLAFSWITFPISVYSVFLYYPVFAVS